MNEKSPPERKQVTDAQAGFDPATGAKASPEGIQSNDASQNGASQDVAEENLASFEPWLIPINIQDGEGLRLNSAGDLSVFEHHGGEQNDHQASSSWMVIFADLIALLLTFFVLHYSMSVLEKEKWRKIVASFTQEISWREDLDGVAQTVPLGLEPLSDVPGVDLDYLASLLERKLSSSDRVRSVVLTRQADRLVLSLPSELVFDKGKAILSEQGRSVVVELSDMIRYLDNAIEVAGHADLDQPGPAGPSNWELSLLRAVTVSKYLKKAGYQGRIRTMGYGDSRFEQLSDRLPENFRERIARRVDIVIHGRVGE